VCVLILGVALERLHGEKKDHTKFSVPHTKVVLPTCKRITLILRETMHKVKMKMSPETYPATVRIIITLHPIRIDVFHIFQFLLTSMNPAQSLTFIYLNHLATF